MRKPSIQLSDKSEIEMVKEGEINQNEFGFQSDKIDFQSILSKKQQPDMIILYQKIQNCISKIKKSEKDQKKQIRIELKEYLAQYFDYNDSLIELFSKLFKGKKLLSYLEANEVQKPVVLRTNTLKSSRLKIIQALEQKKIDIQPLGNWTKVGLLIKSNVQNIPLGATPEYLSGQYFIQSPSSFLPVIALAPQLNETVLDMAAAPGGKTTYIAQLMQNTGLIVANDFKLERITALKYNLFRLGVQNSMVINYDGRDLPNIYKQQFDRVLLDAPCTGLGIIARDSTIKQKKTQKDVDEHSDLQKQLLLSALDCTKKGGYVVYSTCSVSFEENESVVDFALKNRNVKLVEMGLQVGELGFTEFQKIKLDESISKTRRIYPHLHENFDGFYIAKFKKLSDQVQKKVKMQ